MGQVARWGPLIDEALFEYCSRSEGSCKLNRCLLCGAGTESFISFVVLEMYGDML